MRERETLVVTRHLRDTVKKQLHEVRRVKIHLSLVRHFVCVFNSRGRVSVKCVYHLKITVIIAATAAAAAAAKKTLDSE